MHLCLENHGKNLVSFWKGMYKGRLLVTLKIFWDLTENLGGLQIFKMTGTSYHMWWHPASNHFTMVMHDLPICYTWAPHGYLSLNIFAQQSSWLVDINSVCLVPITHPSHLILFHDCMSSGCMLNIKSKSCLQCCYAHPWPQHVIHPRNSEASPANRANCPHNTQTNPTSPHEWQLRLPSHNVCYQIPPWYPPHSQLPPTHMSFHSCWMGHRGGDGNVQAQNS